MMVVVVAKGKCIASDGELVIAADFFVAILYVVQRNQAELNNRCLVVFLNGPMFL